MAMSFPWTLFTIVAAVRLTESTKNDDGLREEDERGSLEALLNVSVVEALNASRVAARTQQVPITMTVEPPVNAMWLRREFVDLKQFQNDLETQVNTYLRNGGTFSYEIQGTTFNDLKVVYEFQTHLNAEQLAQLLDTEIKLSQTFRGTAQAVKLKAPWIPDAMVAGVWWLYGSFPGYNKHYHDVYAMHVRRAGEAQWQVTLRKNSHDQPWGLALDDYPEIYTSIWAIDSAGWQVDVDGRLFEPEKSYSQHFGGRNYNYRGRKGKMVMPVYNDGDIQDGYRIPPTKVQEAPSVQDSPIFRYYFFHGGLLQLCETEVRQEYLSSRPYGDLKFLGPTPTLLGGTPIPPLPTWRPTAPSASAMDTD